MSNKKIHFYSAFILVVFIVVHLFNHIMGIFGAEKHIEIMNALRLAYRNRIIETLLILAMMLQIISGIRLFKKGRKHAQSFFEKLQLWSGLYLAIFFSIHVSAVMVGRFVQHVDTNFYFGVAGLNSFPFNLFFIPYYALAILAFFGHIAAIHHKKVKSSIVGISPTYQSIIILIAGFVLFVVIFYALTNHFKGVQLPVEYQWRIS